MKNQIGKRLREIRLSRGLTQKALANIAGVDYTYIGKIERAEQIPSLRVLIKIAESLSVPPDRFFMDEATFRLLDLLPKGAYTTGKREELWELLKVIKDIPPDCIPFLIEIVKVLKRHREIRCMEEKELPMAAEDYERYNKKKG